jgi:hypothetical protein
MEKKTEWVGVRITPTQRNELESLSSGFGMTMSDFLRDFTFRLISEINNKKNGTKFRN